MRTWLLTVGEPLPTDAGAARLFRAGMLAKTLAGAGHEVVWWTSTFDHFRKQHRSQANTCSLVDGYKLWMLHGPPYKTSLSPSRLRNHRAVAAQFSRLAPSEAPPDVILCSMPTIELSLAATRFARQRGIPVVLDIRDLWPDIFVDHAPFGTRWAARIGLDFMFRQLSEACRDAAAITGITDGCVDWAMPYAGRSRGANDRAFPLAYSAQTPSTELLARAEEFWREKQVGVAADDFTICFFGPISRRYEIRDVVAAAALVSRRKPKCNFVICGTGDDLAACQQLASNLDNVLFPGWVGAPEIWTLLRKSKIGLVPHPSTRDYVLSLPNKAIECLSGGLPVVTSLSGTLQELLAAEDCGIRYANGDVEALASTICDLYDDRLRLQRMAGNATRVFQARFTAESVYGEMCGYLEALSRRAVPSGEQVASPSSGRVWAKAG